MSEYQFIIDKEANLLTIREVIYKPDGTAEILV